VVRDLGNLLTGAAFFAALAHEISGAKHEGLEKAGQIVEDEAKRVIGQGYSSWPPLAESTIREKARLGYDVPNPLLRTGAMRDSIEHTVEGHSAFIGSNSDIARYQEIGTSRIPPRSFLVQGAVTKLPEIARAIGDAVIKRFEG